MPLKTRTKPAAPKVPWMLRAAHNALPRYSNALIESLQDARDLRSSKLSHGDHIVEGSVRQALDAFQQSDFAAIWLGHASVLLRLAGRTILTDPVFSDRIGIRVAGVTLGLSRLRPPVLRVGNLPKIDAILLSHAHFDHLDRPTLKALALGPARGAHVITARSTSRLIPRGFKAISELDWHNAFHLDAPTPIHIHALKPAHWGARKAIDRHRGFNSYLLTEPHTNRRILFAGDTAATSAFNEAGPVDLAVFGIGAYDPWEHAHATPEQVWTMFKQLTTNSPRGHLMPMHHSTFELGKEPVHEPLHRLIQAAGEERSRLVGIEPGSLWTPNLEIVIPSAPAAAL